MLKQRVLTALVLLAVLGLALTVAVPWGFPLFTCLFVVAGVWEWMRLVGLKRRRALLLAVLVGAGLAALPGFFGPDRADLIPPVLIKGLLALSAAIWCLLAMQLVIKRRFITVNRHRLVHAVCGLVLLAACGLAVSRASAEGMLFLVSAMALVWAADIGAYFSGRALGRHKLAPAISPNKTWEGVAGGVLAVWALALLCVLVPALAETFFARVVATVSLPAALGLFTFLTAMSVVGDLFESHLKRDAGAKDSSHLLPGHGGVLDRIDALLPVLPMVMLFWMWS